jgi:hypothetical protein
MHVKFLSSASKNRAIRQWEQRSDFAGKEPPEYWNNGMLD